MYADKLIKLASDDYGLEKATELIEAGQELFLVADLDMKGLSMEKREKELNEFLKNCGPKYYQLYFFLNYKLAKVRAKKVDSQDTSTLAGTNIALGMVANAKKAL